MAELAKLFMSVVDESFYGGGVGPTIPLYIIATQSNKVLDSTTGEIASGTTLANELLVLTSQKDVINTFGVPYFEESNGSVLQSSELNEVGLLGLYNAMGSSALGYAVRADIDLSQLKPTSVEPSTDVKSGTKWLDTYVSTFGVHRCNGGISALALKNWDYVNVKAVDTLPDTAVAGTIVFKGTETGGEFYEYLEGWKLIGSSEWKEMFDEDVDVTFASHIYVPAGKKQGSIWIQTTQPNNGSKYVKKTYNGSVKSWISSIVPLYENVIEAEAGSVLTNGSNVLVYDAEEAKVTLKKYVNSGEGTFISSSEAVTEEQMTGSFKIISRETDGVVVEVRNATLAQVVSTTNTALKDAKVKYIEASVVENKFVLESLDGSTIQVVDGETSVLDALHIVSGTMSEGAWEDETDMKVSIEEPREKAEDGTLWMDDALKLDIMVNNGTDWVGLKSAYPDAELYVTSEEPSTPTDMSVWVDTNLDEYPSVYRFYDGIWNKVDTTDQISAFGMVFGDARYYADGDAEPTFSVESGTGKVTSNLLTSTTVDPDAVEAKSYPKDMLLFNTRFSTRNVKKYKSIAFEGKTADEVPGKTLARWVSASGNDYNGSGLFGAKAQRKLIADALSGAVNSCDELRSINYDFFYACCPGYPEVDSALLDLNADKKEIFYIVSDTPKTLKPTVRAITDWGTNANNGNHGEEGRVLRSAYITRQYPSMGLTTNVDGTSVAVPTSIVKMKNLLNLPTGQICAGAQFGVVSNVSSVGYINDEDEYTSIAINDGIGEAIVAQSMNPIMARRNTGLLLWGENTENNAETSLSDEHAILTLLRLKRELEVAVQPFFFRKNTQSVRNDFDRAIRSILSSYVANEEIYDFVLDTESPNTDETINRKELHANIAIEIVKGIEFIYLPIRVVNKGTLAETTLID